MKYYEFSLFKKIKPVPLKSLYDYLSDSPNLTESIINDLKSSYGISDLKLRSALYIYKCTYGSEDLNEFKMYDLFD